MIVYAPKYYQNFVCIADKCKHSCCIGWEIDVDDVTLEKYNNCSDCYAKAIRESIDFEDTPHFRLCDGERCPHLNEKGLCKIILSMGEDYLCDICREHPRFYHDTVCGKEVGLGMACEEACRLILNSDEYATFDAVEELDIEEYDLEFDALPLREALFSILSDHSLSYEKKRSLIAGKHGVSLSVHTDEEWQNLLASLEYLDASHRSLFSAYSTSVDMEPSLEKSLERALAYFIFRHCSDVEDEMQFRSALGFCLLCERLLASIVTSKKDMIDAARIVSEELEYSEENTERIKDEFFNKML